MGRLNVNNINTEELILILNEFDTMNATSEQIEAWDSFTIGDDNNVGIFEVGPSETPLTWESFTKPILVKAIRKGESIFGDATDIYNNILYDELKCIQINLDELDEDIKNEVYSCLSDEEITLYANYFVSSNISLNDALGEIEYFANALEDTKAHNLPHTLFLDDNKDVLVQCVKTLFNNKDSIC
jgi:hypothetical protein